MPFPAANTGRFAHHRVFFCFNCRDLSTASLHYLSSRQAVADIANFRTKVAKKMGLTRNKWVLFGCSYGGSLAVWSRIKHPDLFAAAVGSSAPMLAKVNFYEYLEGIQRSLCTYNSECLEAVKEAYNQVVEMLKLPKYYSKLESDFMLCKNFKFNSVMDTTFLLERLILPVAANVQNNRNKRNNKVGIVISAFRDMDPDPQRGEVTGLHLYSDNRLKLDLEDFYMLYGEGNQVLIRIDDLCDTMTNTSLGSPYYRFLKITHSVIKEAFLPCLAANYDDKLKTLSDSSINKHNPTQGRQWFYQSCTEFGFFKTTDSKNQPFTGVPLSYFVKLCSDVFGPEFNYDSLKTSVMSTNAYYGGFNVRGSKIIFLNSSFDPWHTLGITKDISKDLPAVFIKGEGHCSEMFKQKDTDSAELIQAREKIFHILQKWLKR
ncbi:putative serine protease K12H4.7 [Trichechus manatus latirostris]|uniref:Serine protease K12H4.7 n=1 Tax=Trichechus manatus latirostris TaxID=127582 RepID=A0A2Y9R0G8_TRIMA|nr:putative serine protease K12H4.7 [Trichechus manatus latirostris]